MAKRIQVGGRIESKEVGGIVTGAAEILDDAKGKKQSVVNQETDDELVRLDQSKQDNLTFDNSPTEGSDNPVKSGGLYTAQQAILLAIAAINELIPSAASTLNKLADKAFVNSSISTNTATFRGTSAAGLNEQQFLAWANGLEHDLNDYVFWQTSDAAGNTLFKRYKWNGTEWAYEYTLNNSTFTAEQWEAIQSGITALLVTKLRALPTAQELIQSFDSKQNVLTFDDVPTLGSTNPVKSSGIYNAIDDEKTRAVGAEQGLGEQIDELDRLIDDIQALIPEEATAQNQLADKADVAAKIVAAIPSWKGQYDALTDLQAVTGAKAGDMGCVKTTDSDGHAVLTFYQYSAQGAWVAYYTLRHYAQNKPETTGTTGDYPYNGMGRIELQKNIVNGLNTLTQAMLTQQNTIYVIQYDFTLASNVTIPVNCMLEFDGGSISGAYTLTGANTGIQAELIEIINTDVILAGTWNVKEVYPEWFGAKGDFTDDASIAIQKTLDLGAGKTVVLKHGNIFKISQTLYVRSNTEVIFDATLKNRISDVAEAPCLQLTSSDPLSDETYGYTGVHDVYIHGNGLYDGNGNDNVTVATCLRMYHAKNIRVEGISFIGWRKYHCIEIGGCKNVYFKSLNFKGGIPEQGELGEVIQFESCTDPISAGGCYPYDGTKCNNVTINSCIFEPEDGYYIHNSIGSHDGNTPNYQENIRIINNIFRYNGTKSVSPVYGCINFDYKFKNVVIENNVIYDYDWGIILNNDVTNISVINNTFSDIYGICIGLYIRNSNSLVDIKNNKFFNCNLQNKIQSNTNCPCIYIVYFSGYGFVKNNYFVLDDNEWSVPFYINDAASNSKLVFQDNYIHGVAETREEVKTVIQNILAKMGSSNTQTLFTDQTKYSMFYDSVLS